jgi:hypothetical protein
MHYWEMRVTVWLAQKWAYLGRSRREAGGDCRPIAHTRDDVESPPANGRKAEAPPPAVETRAAATDATPIVAEREQTLGEIRRLQHPNSSTIRTTAVRSG